MPNTRRAAFLDDTILEINGRRIRISSDVAYALIHSGGEPCEVVVLRDGQTVTLSGVRFPIDEQTGTAVMDFYVYRAPFTVAGVLHEAFFRCVTMMREIYWSIGGGGLHQRPVRPCGDHTGHQ